MKTAKSNCFEGAALSSHVIVVYKDVSLTFPREEMADLQRLLRILGGAAGPVEESPVAARVAEPAAPVESEETVQNSASVPQQTVATHAPSSATKRRNPRGLLWAVVRDFLAASARAQSYSSILKAVRGSGAQLEEIGHGLRITLGRRLSHSHVDMSPAGRYRLTRLGAVQGPFLKTNPAA